MSTGPRKGTVLQTLVWEGREVLRRGQGDHKDTQRLIGAKIKTDRKIVGEHKGRRQKGR